MQTFGYLCAMLPLVEELYDTKEEQKEAMNTYTAFFNTEPQVGSIIVGITAGLEEAKANGNEDIDAEAINGIRAGLMGPLAGIGDSLVVGTLIPILLGIALGLSTGGSVVGPIFYIVAWNLIMAFGMKFLYFKGYELGGKAVDILVGEQATAIREAIVRNNGCWICSSNMGISKNIIPSRKQCRKRILKSSESVRRSIPRILNSSFCNLLLVVNVKEKSISSCYNVNLSSCSIYRSYDRIL
jgi:hypothetical protein